MPSSVGFADSLETTPVMMVQSVPTSQTTYSTGSIQWLKERGYDTSVFSEPIVDQNHNPKEPPYSLLFAIRNVQVQSLKNQRGYDMSAFTPEILGDSTKVNRVGKIIDDLVNLDLPKAPPASTNPFQNASNQSESSQGNSSLKSVSMKNEKDSKLKRSSKLKPVTKKQKKLPKDVAWFKENKLDVTVFNESIKDSTLENSLLWAIYRAQVTELERRGVDMSMFT